MNQSAIYDSLQNKFPHYRKGDVLLIQGECMAVMAMMPDKAVDLAVVDPPYGLKRFEKGIGSNDRHRIKSSGDFNNLVPDKIYFNNLFKISNSQIIWGANNFILPPTEYFCVWDKQQTVDNFASAEYAWVSMTLKKPAKIFKYSIHQHNSDAGKIHPTQKPLKLYSWLYANYAKPDQLIFDSHGGSFSSAIAAHYSGVKFIGCELDEDYYRAAVERFKQATSQVDIFA